MKTVSNTLLLSIAVVFAGLNLHCNKMGGSSGGAGAQEFDWASAYISVDTTDIDSLEMLNSTTESYAHIAGGAGILRRAINADKTEDGRNRDRIRKTSYFTGDLQGTIHKLREDLQVTAVRDTNLIRISLKSAPTKERPDIINAVADAIVFHAAQMHKHLLAERMKNFVTRLEELNGRISVKQKSIEQIRGASSVPIMEAQGKTTNNTLAMLTNELLSLRLQKARAESDLESLRDQEKAKTLATSFEVKHAVAGDPSVVELRSAVLKAGISALGNGGDKKLADMQNSLTTMLAKKEQSVAGETAQFMIYKAQARVTNISEQLLAVGNQYNESMAVQRDMQVYLQKTRTLQSGIDRLEKQAEKLNNELLSMRIELELFPLHVQKVAELP